MQKKLLGGLPRELVKQLHLLNLKDPEDVRNYLVKYEQLESYLPAVDDAGKVNAVVATTPPRQNSSNQGTWHTPNSNRNNVPNNGFFFRQSSIQS
jgi:hypothetical protein